ncbi:hypothetical protein CAC42_5716 [Sphaceloma murrayae]|uniref:Uncharacterized protein n=1 Tax=Sphaceloma murrayae TaxID=2082308 RepID=A0A2K1QYY4_9PEZI|nr:hypothetical protein CAC42_5716 [Sphaceloma murrayae]
MSHILRDWFLPEDGIRREVISADIQSFLGNDATVNGYWIRAYRNLTSNMIADLKHKSSKWDQESKRTGKRGSKTPEVGPQNNPDHDAVNYEDSRTFREQTGGRHDTGKNSPRVEVTYAAAPPSRHAAHPDAMDYEPTRTVTRPEPHPRTPLANTGAVVGSYGESVAYAPSRSAPPGYIMQGNEYVPESAYHASRLAAAGRNSPQHIPGYAGHPPHHTREVDMVDPRYLPTREARDSRDPREDPRYPLRDDGRYSHSRDDMRYAATREDPRYHPEEARHRPVREDPRYASTMAREEARYASAPPREDPRYASSRDHRREDPRYQTMAREDPRLVAGYQDPHAASYAQPQVYDQYGRPVVLPHDVQAVQPIYQSQPSTRMETPYSNSSRKRGAPPEESSRHGHGHAHGRMR